MNKHDALNITAPLGYERPEPMENKEAGIAVENIYQRILDNHFPCSDCWECKDFEETKDPAATMPLVGYASPTEYNCGGLPEKCPIVKYIIERMGGLLK